MSVNVTTFAQIGGVGCIDSAGNIYIANTSQGVINKVTPGGVVTTIASGFNNPQGIVLDSTGNLFVSDSYNSTIRKVTPSGVVSTIAGQVTQGFVDATGTSAKFAVPRGITIDSKGNLYVADTSNHRIRKVTQSGVVTTVAGSGTAGSLDGTGTSAQFSSPFGITIDSNDNLYVADTYSSKIRKVTLGGVVTTVAGEGVLGTRDGSGTGARFNKPVGLAVGPDGNIYVTDTYNNSIRKVTPEGAVTTIIRGSMSYPNSIVVKSNRAFYVLETNRTIKIIFCTEPSGTQYVTSICSDTADTQFGTKTCSSNQYLSGFSAGSSTLLGSAGTCINCSEPTSTQYVFRTCSTYSDTFILTPMCYGKLQGFSSGSSTSVGSAGNCIIDSSVIMSNAPTWTELVSGTNGVTSGPWNSVAWSPQLKLFVAVSGSDTPVIYSSDGVNWTAIPNGTKGVVKSNWNSITWSPSLNRFVAVAFAYLNGPYNAVVMYSSDGINWTTILLGQNGTGNGAQWNSVTWSPELNRFVAVSGAGYYTIMVMYSSDGINWTIISSGWNGVVNSAYRSITWSSNLKRFVAVGDGKIMYSSDGINWVTFTPFTGDWSTNYWNSVTWSPYLNIFVAVSNINKGVAYSFDGINWIRISPDTAVSKTNGVPMNEWKSITWCDRTKSFMAISPTGAIISSNGINWNRHPNSIPASSLSIIFAQEIGKYIIVGDSITYSSYICSEPGYNQYVSTICNKSAGTDTEFGTKPICTAGQFPVGFNPGTVVSLGSPGTCGKCSEPTGDQYVKSICNPNQDTQFGTKLSTCPSGQTVTGFYPGTPLLVGVPGVCTNCSQPTGNQYVKSVCSSGQDTQFATMSCPVNQYASGFNAGTALSLGSAGTCTNCSQPTGNQYVNSVCSSTRDTQFGTKLLTCPSGQRPIGFNPGTINSLGSPGTCANCSNPPPQEFQKSLACSQQIQADGSTIKWTVFTNFVPSGNWIRSSSVAWSSNLSLFVSVSDTIAETAYSLDGNTWYNGTNTNGSTYKSVTWSPELSMFVAVGTNAIMYSFNGINWSVIGKQGLWNTVTWSPDLKMFVALCNSSTSTIIATVSYNGIDWNLLTYGMGGFLMPSNWSSITWSPELKLFVAVSPTTPFFMKSTDGLSWAGINQIPQANWSSVAWSPTLRKFVAVSNGSGLVVMYSSDGTNWSTISSGNNGVVTANWISVKWIPELGYFIAVSNNSDQVAMQSIDGINWTDGTNGLRKGAWTAFEWSPDLRRFVISSLSETGYSCSKIFGFHYVKKLCDTNSDTEIKAVICKPGEYINISTAVGSATTLGTGCTPCAAGTYSSTESTVSCTPCPPGTYSTVVGATSSASCMPCPSGLFSVAGSQACISACPPETLVTLGSACLMICLAGKYKSGTTCQTCPAGTFYVGPGANSAGDCVPCGPGTYSGLGFPVCLNCPLGTSFSGTRGTSDAVCVPCTAGTYSNKTGSTSCSSCPTGTTSSSGSAFCSQATGGEIENRGFYVTHTFTTSGNFVPLSTSGLTIVDFISVTPTQIYSSPDIFTVTQTTPITISSTSTPTMSGKIPYLNPSTTLVTEYGTFTTGTPQITIVYLKDPCPSGTFWNPLKKQCVPTCTVPFTTSQNGVCVKCSSRAMALGPPLVCEPGFTLSGTTCTGVENKCPDELWTLSGTTCTKTNMICPGDSQMTSKNYCLYSDGTSSIPVSNTLSQPAVYTSVTKPAYGSVCVASCPVNTYMSNGECISCPDGQVSVSGSTSINACQCPAGKFGLNGSGVCTSCGPNQTSPQGTQDQSGCILSCPAGSYANGTSCTPCPYGTSPVGSVSVTACACPPGQFLSGGTCISQCPPGMYGDGVTKSCTTCPGTQTSPAGTVGITGCTCPDGSGGVNGSGTCVPCIGGQTSTLTTSGCPDSSWTLTGSVCSKVSAYDCPGDSYNTANVCYSTQYTMPYSGCTLDSYTCPSGYTLNGSVCTKTGQPIQTATVNIKCPTTSYTCPSGYTLSGTTCTATTSSGYTCPSGNGSITTGTNGSLTTIGNSVLEGSTCKQYTCTGVGVALVGTNCVQQTSTITCPPDKPTLVDGVCYNYTCPSGWTLVPPGEVLKFSLQVTSTYMCKSPTGTNCGSSYTYNSATGKCVDCFKVYRYANGNYASGTYTASCTADVGASGANLCLTYIYDDPTRPLVMHKYCLPPIDRGDPEYTYQNPTASSYAVAIPTYTSSAAQVSSSTNASLKYDTIPASPTTQSRQITGVLTRQSASIRTVDRVNATTSQINTKQCMCPSNNYWDFSTKMCVDKCPAATYADVNSKTCANCPANKTSPIGSTSVSQCVCSYSAPYWSGVSCMQQFNPSSVATGGTIMYNNRYTIHTFTDSGTFNALKTLSTNVLAVGGGSGGTNTAYPGNGADVVIKNMSFDPGSHTITIGAGGSLTRSMGGNTTVVTPNIGLRLIAAAASASSVTAFGEHGTMTINDVVQTKTDAPRTFTSFKYYVNSTTNLPASIPVLGFMLCSITQPVSMMCAYMSLPRFTTSDYKVYNYGTSGKDGWCIRDDQWGPAQMCFGGGGGGISASGKNGGGDGLYIDFFNNQVRSPVFSASPNSGSGGGANLTDFNITGSTANGGSGIVKISYITSTTCPAELPFYDFELLSPVCTNCLQYDSRLPLYDSSTGLCTACPSGKYYDPSTKTCVSTCPDPLTPNPQFNNICAVPPLICQGARPYFNGYECSAAQVNFSTQGGAIGGNSVINNGVNVIHVFTSSGTFIPPGDKILTGDVLIVGGGGGGGTYSIEDFVNPRTAGGGGGGEVQYKTGVSFGQQSWVVTIGQGGNPNQNGGDTSFGTYVAKGGGAGGSPGHARGFDGSSGGGSVYNDVNGNATNGFGGGIGAIGGAGGGGGAYAQGGFGSNGIGGYGGSGVSNSLTGSVKYYGGGGGGSGVLASRSITNVPYISGGSGGAGGQGGGGAGAGPVVYNYAGYQKTNMVRGENGTPNTGGGGGGGADVASPGTGTYIGNPVTTPGSYGGSGIVIIRYSTTGLCPSNLPYFNPGLKTCTNCPDATPLYNTSTGSCVACPSATPFWNGLNCVAACPSVLPRADQNKVCQLPCVGAAPNWDGNQCTTVCPETKPIATNGVCGACPSATPNWNPVTKTCVAACPEFVQGNVCRTCYDIDSTKPYWDGAACQACPADTPAWTGPLTGCQPCAPATPVFYQGQCRACYDISPLRPFYNKTPGGYKFSSINRCQPCPVLSTPAWNNTSKTCQTCVAATSVATPYWDTVTNACTACPATKPYWNSRVCTLPTNIITTPMTAPTTSNVTASATASASSTLPWQAFDGSSTTYWQSAGAYTANGPYTGKRITRDMSDAQWAGEFLQIEFPYRYIISSYTLSSPNLLRWVVLGSGDGFVWDVIDNKTASDTTNYSQTFYITPPLSNSYPVYRLVATKSSGTSVSVTEWSLQTANAVVTTQTTQQKSALTVISGAIEGCDSIECVIDKSSRTDITDLVYGNYPATQVGTALLPDKAQQALSNCSSNVDCGFVQFDFLSNVSKFSTSAPYTVATTMTTGTDVGLFQKKYGVSPPPRLRAPPGLTFGYYYIEGTKLGSNLTATVDVCGQACTANPACKGFNFYYISSVCEFYSTVSTNEKYSPEKGSFVRDSHILTGEQNGNRLQYTALDTAGSACQNMTACNTDVSSLVGQLGTTLQSFSTAELDSCNYCPIRSVAKQGSVYTITNEMDIVSNVGTTTDVLGNMLFLNQLPSASNDKISSSQLGNSKTFDLVFDAEFTDTIAMVKQKIYQTKGIPVSKQRIITKDSYGMPHVVDDNTTLNDIKNSINGVDYTPQLYVNA